MATIVMSTRPSPLLYAVGASVPYAKPHFPCRAVGRRRPFVVAAGTGRTRIHRLIEEEGIVLMPGCYDTLSATILQQSGFSAGFISGYALSA